MLLGQAARYNIGGCEYTADDLENGILRGNRPAASSLGMLLGVPKLSSGPFGRGDPRAAKVGHPPGATGISAAGERVTLFLSICTLPNPFFRTPV
jgi:hypothetical protein